MSNHSQRPTLEREPLIERLQSLRGAMGSSVLVVIRRRTPLTGSPSYEVLAAVDASGTCSAPEREFPLAMIERLGRTGRHLDLRADTAWTDRWMHNHRVSRLMGWSLPGDRAPCVFFVAVYTGNDELRDTRRRVALAGMEALARALAPPGWMQAMAAPVAVRATGKEPERDWWLDAEGDEGGMNGFPSLRDAVVRMERTLIRRALQQYEGNKSATARALKMSRQGLYKKLKQHGLSGG